MAARLAKEIVVYGVAHGLGKVLLLLLLLLYAHWFPPELYGVIDLITVLLAFTSSIGTLQMPGSSGRYFYEISPDRRGNLFYSSSIIISVCTLIICLVVFAFASNLSQLLFDNNDYISLIRFVCLIIPLDSFFRYSVSVIRLLKKPLLYGKVYLTQTLATLVFSILFILITSHGVYGVFYALLISYVLGLSVAIYYILKYIPGKKQWDYAYAKSALKYSLPLLPAVLSGWLNQYANRFVFLGMMGLFEIGLLSFALKVAAIITLLEEAIKMTWTPYVFESLNLANHKALYRNAFKNLSALVFGVLTFVILLLPEVIDLIAPPEYSVSTNAIILIMIAFGVQALQQIVLVGIGISKKTYQFSILSFVTTMVNILLLIWLVPHWGIFGVGVAFLTGNVIRFSLGWYISERLYKVHYRLKSILPYFILIGLVALFVGMVDSQLIIRFLLALIITSAIVIIHREDVIKILTAVRTKQYD